MTALDQTTPLSAERRADIKAKVERAHSEIGSVAAHGPHTRFRMSVPADPDRDTDLIISDALKGAEDLLAEVDRLSSELSWLSECAAGVGGISAGLPDSEEVARLRQAVNAYQATIDRVARLQVVTHGCGGSVMRVVFAEHLYTALGLSPDGKGVG